jgi:hypothetical protein
MGTTGHWVSYYETNTTEKVREWLRKQYTWDEWVVLDLAQGTKLRSNWWLVLKNAETGKVRALQVITSNRAKSENTFYTKEVGEDMGPHSTDIPKRLFALLTPLEPDESPYAEKWREEVTNGTVRG